MQRLISRVKRWFAAAPAASLEDHFFHGLCVLAGAVSLLIVVPTNLLQNLDLRVTEVIALFGVAALVLAWQARRGRFHKRTLIVLLVACLDVVWFPNGGRAGSIGLFFFICPLYVVLFLDGTARRLGVALTIANVLGLLWAEETWPQLAVPYASPRDRLLDLSTGYLISLLVSALILWVVLEGFKRERLAREESARALAGSEQRYRTLFENAPIGIYRTTPAGEVLVVNPALARVLGYESADAVRSRNLETDSFAPGYPRSDFVAAMERDGRVRGLETTWRSQSGRSVFVRENAERVLGPDGATFYEGTVEDITERKQAEAAAARFAVIIESSIDAVIMHGTDHRILVWNGAAETLYGWTAAEAIGRPIQELVVAPPELLAAQRDSVECVLSGASRSGFDAVRIGRDGRRVDVSISGFPIREGGAVVAVASIHRDISTRRRAEAALHRLNRELRATSLCNQALARATDERELLGEVCRLVCDEAGFRLAWVAYVDQDLARTVRAAAWAGVESGTIAQSLITGSVDAAGANGPVGEALRTGAVVVVEDIETDPGMGTARAAALERGLRSGAVLPLKGAGAAAFGALIVFSAEARGVGPDDVRLLGGLADDLSFGIAALRGRAALAASEAARRESEERYRLLVELSPVGILVHRDGRFVYANPAATGMLRADSPAQLIGKSVLDIVHPDFREVVRRRVEVASSGATNAMAEQRLLRLDGQAIDVSIQGTPVQYEGGPAVQVSFLDMTEQRRAEVERVESQARMKAVFDSTSDFIWSVGAERFELTTYNATLERFYREHHGIELRPGMPWQELFPPGPFLDFWNQTYARALKEAPFNVRFETSTKTHILQLTLHLLVNDGKAFGISVFGRDVTGLARLEEDQKKLEAQMRQVDKMESLGSLAGGVAHDMNNVLGAILGIASSIQHEAEPDSELSQDMATIAGACRRGGTLVKGLLSFARKGLAEERELDLNGLVREEIALLERSTLQKVRLVTDLAGDLRSLRGDPAALTHALMNLCVNAVDAMPGGGTLTLRTRNQSTGSLILEVEDTGSGMPKAVLDRALEPFFTTKPQGKGTGLGLAMVYSTVKAHGGELEIHSEPGKGTRIAMIFPASAPSPAESNPAMHVAFRATIAPLNVLVIDDDPLIRDAVQAVLRALGHSATIVSSGDEGLAKLETGPAPDVVLLDRNMPGLDGAGTLARIRILTRSVPVLLTTGVFDEDARSLAESHPRVALLPKPFSVDELQARLLDAVGPVTQRSATRGLSAAPPG